MNIRFLAILACVFATSFLMARIAPAPLSSFNTPISPTSSCELPAPTDQHLVEQGPTWVILGWTPIIDGAQHHIKIYRTSDNFLLNDLVVPAGQKKASIDNLPPNTAMYTTISTICQNGEDGPPSSVLPIRAFIIDIIVAGFTPGTESSCPIQSGGQSCNFYTSEAMTPFKISRNNDSRQFGVWAEINTSNAFYHVNIGTNGNSGQKIIINCDNNNNVPCSANSRIRIAYDPGHGSLIKIADFELIQTSNTNEGILKCLFLASGWVIDRMGPGPSGEDFAGPGKGAPIGFQNNNNFPMAIASPNPFSNTLDIFPNNPAAASITLQMYNLSGQKVLDQQLAGGQEQYSLSTEGLSNGFYFLRIEADGQVQTLKVIKSE